MNTLLIILRHRGNASPESIAVILVIALIVFVYKAFFNERAVLKRKLQKAPTRNIGDVKNGEVVKIIGKVVFAGRTVKAGLSERECSFYHVEVEEYRRSGKSGLVERICVISAISGKKWDSL